MADPLAGIEKEDTMIRTSSSGRIAPMHRSRSHAFPAPLRRVFAGLLVTSVLAAVVGSWGSHAQADPLPPILHETLACNAPLLAANSAPSRPTPTPGPQHLAIPSYFRPDTEDDDDPYWTQMEQGVPTVRLAIINPASGPGFSPDKLYQDQVAHSHAAGLLVLGYVDTGYGLDPIWDVKCQVDLYYDRYGVDGIFFDQASTDADGDDSMVSYYKEIYEYVKKMPGEGVVVINPGTRTDPAYMDTADIIVNFEGFYSSYAADTSWDDDVLDWERDFPTHRFWHLVHTTPRSNMPTAIEFSQKRHAGWVYVTPDLFKDDPTTPGVNEIALICDDPDTPENEVDDPNTQAEEVGEVCNPWNTLPPDSSPGSYWRDMLDRVAS